MQRHETEVICSVLPLQLWVWLFWLLLIIIIMCVSAVVYLRVFKLWRWFCWCWLFLSTHTAGVIIIIIIIPLAVICNKLVQNQLTQKYQRGIKPQERFLFIKYVHCLAFFSANTTTTQCNSFFPCISHAGSFLLYLWLEMVKSKHLIRTHTENENDEKKTKTRVRHSVKRKKRNKLHHYKATVIRILERVECVLDICFFLSIRLSENIWNSKAEKNKKNQNEKCNHFLYHFQIIKECMESLHWSESETKEKLNQHRPARCHCKINKWSLKWPIFNLDHSAFEGDTRQIRKKIARFLSHFADPNLERNFWEDDAYVLWVVYFIIIKYFALIDQN